MVPTGLTCDNNGFAGDLEQNLHYKWHRYNLKRKVAGVPEVTETLFLSRRLPDDQEHNNLDNDTNITTSAAAYSCGLCGKGYQRSKSYSRHLKSKSHLIKASQDLDPSRCFMCDSGHASIEECTAHMHKHHGFFIPDVEYLNNPKGLLTYLSIKVKRDFTCLYCNERRRPFGSLEAVRKHMEAKCHCKVHYGDGSEDEEAELEEFYDYTTSYVDEDGKQQVVAVGDMENVVQLGIGGHELVITKRDNNNGTSKSIKMIGSREYLRYYRQKPRPTPANSAAVNIAASASSRCKKMITVKSSKEKNLVRKEVMKAMNVCGVEMMRSKISINNSNAIRNLPKSKYCNF